MIQFHSGKSWGNIWQSTPCLEYCSIFAAWAYISRSILYVNWRVGLSTKLREELNKYVLFLLFRKTERKILEEVWYIWLKQQIRISRWASQEYNKTPKPLTLHKHPRLHETAPHANFRQSKVYAISSLRQWNVQYSNNKEWYGRCSSNLYHHRFSTHPEHLLAWQYCSSIIPSTTSLRLGVR